MAYMLEQREMQERNKNIYSNRVPFITKKLEIRILEQFLTDSGRQPDLFSKDFSDGITEELVYDHIVSHLPIVETGIACT